MLDDSVLDVDDSELILRSETALGHGVMDNVRYVVYVRPALSTAPATRRWRAK